MKKQIKGFLEVDNFTGDLIFILKDLVYDSNLKDFIHSVTVDDEILNYLSKRQVTEDDLKRLFKHNLKLDVKIPLRLLF